MFEAEAFVIRLTDMPKAKGPCWDQAKSLSEKFTLQTGITDAQGICAAEKTKSYEIHIEYTAELPVKRIQGGHWDSPLIYSTAEICEENRLAQSEIFEAETGAPLFVSYCKERDTYFAEDRFEVEMLAFGEAVKAPFFGSSYLFGKIYGHSASTFKEEVGNLFKVKGAVLASTRITSSIGNSRLSVLYYSTERLTMSSDNSGAIPTKEACLAEANGVNEDLEKSSLLAYCTSFTSFEVSYLWLGAENNFSFIPSGKSYKTYDECSANKIQTLKDFGAMVNGVKSGVCNSNKEGVFTLTLVKQNK